MYACVRPLLFAACLCARLCTGANIARDNEELFDYDACSMNVHGCSAFATCLVGSFRASDDRGYVCECNKGWEGDGFTCENVNECKPHETVENGRKKRQSKNVCGRQGTCVDTPGSFYCVCDEGYAQTAPNGVCHDVDECAGATNNCAADASCINVPGSFSCHCPIGFNGDGTTHCESFCAPAAPAQRVDCFPEGNATKGLCESRSCCFDDDTARVQPAGVPACFYPLPANAYNVTSWKPFSAGILAKLECSGKSRYGDGQVRGADLRNKHVCLLFCSTTDRLLRVDRVLTE